MSAYERNPHVAPTRIGVYPKRRSAAPAPVSAPSDRREPCYADFLRAPQGQKAVA